MADVKKISVIIPRKPHYGAMVIQLPVFMNLRRLYPNAKIRVWSPIEDCNFFLKSNFVDDVYVYKNRRGLSLIREIRKYKAELFINLSPYSEHDHICAVLSGAKLKAGFEPQSSILKNRYTATYKYRGNQYRALNYIKLFTSLFNEVESDFKIIETLKEKSELTVKKNSICIMPGGAEGDFKRWGIENFIKLFKELKEDETVNFAYFIMGSDEKKYLPIIEKELPSKSYEIVMNAPPSDIVKIVSEVECSVANDCGPSHYAQLLRKKYVALFGWKYETALETMCEWYLPAKNNLAIIPDERLKKISTISVAKVKGAVKLLVELNDE